MSLKLITADRRLWPLFFTQFLGALNDNIFKNALVIMVTYQSVKVGNLNPGQVVALASALFVLPFFLFSPLAGQLSDKMEKSRLVRLTKYWEVAIMLLAAYGFIRHEFEILLGVLFLAGVQAALFGPVKYSLLPESVEENELISANALVEMGTFLAILAGTVAGGLLNEFSGREYVISGVLLTLSLLGVVTARFVLGHPPAAPELNIRVNPVPSFAALYRVVERDRAVSHSVLGISWFWFFGAAVLSILPLYGKLFLNAEESVVTAFLGLFTIGIGLGGLVCGKLSFNRTEIGLVPIGSIGLSLFLADLARRKPDWDVGWPIGLTRFMATHAGPLIAGDFFMVSLFGGLFILPLYTLIQERSLNKERSRVIAANNVANAIFMVAASLLVLGWTAYSVTYPHMLLGLAALNLLAGIFLSWRVPEFIWRLFAWTLARAIYRIRAVNEERIPRTGAAVLICNHVSYFDWLIVLAMIRRPVRFIVYYQVGDRKWLAKLMRAARVVTIGRATEITNGPEAVFDAISNSLRAGELICVFPEGRLTLSGGVGEFHHGIERILARDPVRVIPVAIDAWWGAHLAPRRWWRRVNFNIGLSIAADEATPLTLARAVEKLNGDADDEL